MTVKRTELEILDMAIMLSQNKERLTCILNNKHEMNIKCRYGEEPKLKKDDIEGLKRMYERKLDIQREELRAENQKEVWETEITEQIKANDKAIELLRWLYKETGELVNG